MMPPAVSVIVPVLHDAAALAALLGTFSGWTRRPDEVIVVCADGDPAVRATARSHGARTLDAPANRGAQLDAGARAATGELLWFLHADAAPPAAAIDAMLEAIGGGAESGCFRFAFAGARRPLKRLLEWLIALRIRLGGIAYGDQGLFATRAAYVESGGFAPTPLFEEVPLVRALRRRGSFRALDTPLLVATRRWERDGWWRRTLHNRWLATCYMFGIAPAKLAERYRQTARATAETEV